MGNCLTNPCPLSQKNTVTTLDNYGSLNGNNSQCFPANSLNFGQFNSFLTPTTVKEFINSLQNEELKDKKRLVVWFKMLKDGSFDEVCKKKPESIYNKAVGEGCPPKFRWLFFRSVTDYKLSYKVGLFDELAEKGKVTY